jgi:hypothetical protein
MKSKTQIVILAIAALILTLAFSSTGLVSDVSAKITSVCKNPGGQEPQGNCSGEALEEENQNPSGKAPPGQNK